jgi:hypothetical protein
MIFVISLLGILFFRFVFGIIRGLLLIFLFVWLLVDESRIHPQFGKMFWESVTATAQKVADFGRDQQLWNSNEAGCSIRYENDQTHAAPRPLPDRAYDRLGAGYR